MVVFTISPDGSLVVATHEDKSVSIWDAYSESIIARNMRVGRETTELEYSLSFSPRGKDC